MAHLAVGHRFESPAFEGLGEFPVRGEGHPFDPPQAMTKQVERAFSSHRRVELFERAGRGIARIREQRLSGCSPLAVELAKRFPGQEHLAPHF